MNQNLLDNLLEKELELLKRRALSRNLEIISSSSATEIVIDQKSYLNFSSNNYLGLSYHPKVKQAASLAVQQWGVGSGASRLVSGNLEIHEILEKALADFKSEKAATVFSSGYLANLGVITALLGPKDLIILDRLNHASLIDAAKLSKAKTWVYPHKDAKALAKILERSKNFGTKLVVTDAYFSMDGDIAPLDELVKVCRQYDAYLMIDEAHSTGVFGKTGHGLTEHFGLSGKIDVVMGTLSKALGSVGGFVAGSHVLKKTLIQKARSFIYTTGPAPAASAAALQALLVIESEPLLKKTLWDSIDFLRGQLLKMNFDLMDSQGPIIPILIGDTTKTLKAKEFLKARGIFIPAIRPPTVSKGSDRLRLSLTASHTQKDLEKLIATLGQLKKEIL